MPRTKSAFDFYSVALENGSGSVSAPGSGIAVRAARFNASETKKIPVLRANGEW
jgi:hypothetical protein